MIQYAPGRLRAYFLTRSQTHAHEWVCSEPHWQVHLARVLETGELVALKGIHVRSRGQGLPDNVVREIMCLRTVEDPHVVRLRDVFPKVCNKVQCWFLHAQNWLLHLSLCLSQDRP